MLTPRGLRRHSILWVWLGSLILSWAGCQSGDKTPPYLIRSGSIRVTLLEFQQSLEVAKAAYPHKALADPGVMKVIRLRLLNQLIEQTVLLRLAEENGIRVSDSDLDAAVQAILSDYPEGVFESLCQESAVSFDVWRQQYRKRLIMEKVVRSTLANTLPVTPEEVGAWLDQAAFDEDSADEEPGVSSENQPDEATVLRRVQREKAETLYTEWLERMQLEFQVEINQTAWAALFGEDT